MNNSKSCFYKSLSKVDGVDMSKLDLNNFHSQEQIDAMESKLKKEGIKYIEKFKNLKKEIVDAIKV